MDGYQPGQPQASGSPRPPAGPPPLIAPALARPGAQPSPGARLLAAMQLLLIVIGAVMMRELHTRFGRHNMGYMWLFFEPMILGGCIAGFHFASGHGLPGGMEVLSFYIVGYTPYYLFRSILNRAAGALQANSTLFYHRQITFLDVMIARNVLDCAAVMIAVSVMLLGLGVFTGQWPHDLVWMAFGIILITLLCHGFALLIVAATAWGVENVERVVHPMTYLMIPITGAFYMVWWFPTELQAVLLLNPTVHMFEIIREGQFGPVVPYHYDIAYVAACIGVINLLGMLALSAAKRRIEFN